MRESTLKGLFHTALVAAAAAEIFTAKSNLRRLLLGACAGWHIVAAVEHLAIERRQEMKYHGDYPKIDKSKWGSGSGPLKTVVFDDYGCKIDTSELTAGCVPSWEGPCGPVFENEVSRSVGFVGKRLTTADPQWKDVVVLNEREG